jgi:hypothetical protein
MTGRRTPICVIILFIIICCGIVYLYPFIAKNLNLFPELETDEPLELSWVEGPLEGDVYCGIWYNDSLELELRNNSTDHAYQIHNYIIVSHESDILESVDLTLAISVYQEELGVWTSPQSMDFDETSDITGNPILFGEFFLGDGIIHAKYTTSTWHWYFRLYMRISEHAPAGLWEMTIRVVADLA